MEVRPLYRPNRESAPRGITLPRDDHDKIGQFLDATLMRPLWSSVADQDSAINNALDTLTFPERVFIELEMRDREREMYSSDYDPLR